MHITERLYDLIETYSLDRYNPRFQQYRKAVRLINELADSFREDARILLVGCTQTDIQRVISDCERLRNAEQLVVSMENQSSLEKLDASRFDEIVIVSLTWHLEMAYILARRGIPAHDLYRLFYNHALFIEHDYYQIFGGKYLRDSPYRASSDYKFFDLQREIFYAYRAYAQSNEREPRSVYLGRCIFACLLSKNLLNAQKYIRIYCQEALPDYKQYTKALDALDALIKEIRRTAHERLKGSLWMFWLDALEYGEDKHMPFLRSLSEKSLTFENAYTVTPYTEQTLKTIVYGEKVAEGKTYRIQKIGDDSPLLRLAGQYQLDVQYCGAPLSRYWQDKNIAKPYIYITYTLSEFFWAALEKALQSDKPVFMIVHEVYGSHWPYICLNPEDTEDYVFPDMYGVIDYEEQKKQHSLSLKAMDQQLEFFSSFLPKDGRKIYMSDHGNTAMGRFHALLKVLGPDIPRRTVQELFTYLDFCGLLDYILRPEEKKLKELGRGYVEIQDVPYYNGYAIGKFFERKLLQGLLGYRGIVTPQLLYKRSDFGVEECAAVRNLTLAEFEDSLAFCRGKTGRSAIDVENDENFQYSKYVYRAYQKYFARSGETLEKMYGLIRGLFSDENRTCAVRSGGYTAMRLLLSLEASQRKNIRYIIDQDPGCICGKLGYPVITLEEAEKFEIDRIVMPSLKLRKKLMRGLEGLKAEIVDLYDYLEQHGIRCTKDFYHPILTDEDCDVGFPFSEVGL